VLGDQIDDAVGDGKFELNVGITGEEVRDRRNELVRRKPVTSVDMEMPARGGAQFGHLGFHFLDIGDTASVVICHCTDCQTLSGSAFRTVLPAKEGTFRLLSGEPRVYVKTGDSGNKREQTFCADCGTPVYSAPVGGAAKVVALRVGTVRQRDQLTPTDQYWSRSAQPWLEKLPTIKRTETQPVFDAKGGFGR
jgi:hypothetical protein